MVIFFETDNFVVESHDKPEISREEGGHIKISPKVDYSDRTKLDSKLAIELMRLSIICGHAMKVAMLKQGIEIGRINYQENGNWKPHLHIHLYCRAINAKIQKYGDPIVAGHKEGFISLNEMDRKLIKIEIEKLLLLDEYSDLKWGLN